MRNEPVGLYERLAYTLENNNGQNVTLWFLSDSATDYFEYENTVVNKLRTRFGKEKIRYRHRPYPEDAKPGNIKEWLIHHHQEYTFFFVCDADSMIPKGALLKLLQKGEHPDNAHVAIFQTRIEIAHAKTLFSKYQALSARTSQKLYTDVKQRFFRTALSFGHGNLIRTNAFLRIQVPKGVLSHDIWDMALLNQLGYKTVYCPDVVSFEEAPNNYLEMRIRDRRWIKGNFQSAPLLLKKGLSLGTRFYLSYGLFMYLCQPIVLCWIVLNLMGNSSLWGQFLYFKPIINTGMHPLYIEMSTCTIIILSLVFLHKFVLCKTLRDCSLIMKETIFSTLLSLNNIIYHTIDILIISFQTIRWVPMKKNPYATLTFIKATRQMWPGTLFGIAVVYFIMNYCPHIALLIVPIVIIFSLSIPIMYITSLPLSR
ncbi:MAG: glycosyltransferase family 2 protein [Candidatus Omnitrophota bacterium]